MNFSLFLSLCRLRFLFSLFLKVLFFLVFLLYSPVASAVNQWCFDICFEIVTNWNTTKFLPFRAHWLLLSAPGLLCQMLKIITRDATEERDFYFKLVISIFVVVKIRQITVNLLQSRISKNVYKVRTLDPMLSLKIQWLMSIKNADIMFEM